MNNSESAIRKGPRRMSEDHRLAEVLARVAQDDEGDTEATLFKVVRTARRRRQRRHAFVGITVTASIVTVTALGAMSLLGGLRDTSVPESSAGGRDVALCIGAQSLEEILADTDSFYDAAFVGEVSAIDAAVAGGTGADGIYPRGEYFPVTFSVSEVLKGEVPPTAIVMVAAYDNEDEVSFEAGRKYLVVAHSNPDGTYSTNACVPTEPLSLSEAG